MRQVSGKADCTQRQQVCECAVGILNSHYREQEMAFLREIREQHWIYMIVELLLLVLSFLLFMKKYYHLHEEYLNGIESN